MDHPFFRKELNAAARHRFRPFGTLITARWVLLLLPLLFTQWLRHVGLSDEPFFHRIALGVLLNLDAIACVMAGTALAEFVVRDEIVRETLPALRLVALSPEQVVRRKFLFPVLGLLLVWMVGFPGYVMLVLHQDLRVAEATSLAGLSLAMGLLRLGSAAGRFRTAAPTLVAEPQSRIWRWISRGSGLVELGGLLLIVRIGLHWLNAVEAGARPSLPALPFFTGHSSSALWLTLLCGGAWLISYRTACALYSPEVRRWSTTVRSTYVVLAPVLLLAAGFAWNGPLASGPGVAVSLLTGVMLVKKACRLWRQRTRGWSARVTQTLLTVASHVPGGDNPIFGRDLRAGLSAVSPASWLLQPAIILLALTGMLLAATYVRPMAGLIGGAFPPSGVPWQDAGRRLSILVSFFGPMVLMAQAIGLGSHARQMWNRERGAGRIEQLFLIPLSSRAMVNGRWAASVLQGWPGVFAAVVLLLPVFLSRGQAAESYLLLSIHLFTLGLMLAGSSAAWHPDGETRNASLGGICLLTQGVVLLAEASVLTSSSLLSLAPHVVQAASVAAILFNLLVTRGFYEGSVRALDRCRAGIEPGLPVTPDTGSSNSPRQPRALARAEEHLRAKWLPPDPEDPLPRLVSV